MSHDSWPSEGLEAWKTPPGSRRRRLTWQTRPICVFFAAQRSAHTTCTPILCLRSAANMGQYWDIASLDRRQKEELGKLSECLFSGGLHFITERLHRQSMYLVDLDRDNNPQVMLPVSRSTVSHSEVGHIEIKLFLLLLASATKPLAPLMRAIMKSHIPPSEVRQLWLSQPLPTANTAFPRGAWN